MLKSTALYVLLVLVVAVQNGSAIPFQNEENVRQLYSEVSASMKKLTSEFETALQNVGKSVEWAFNHTESVLRDLLQKKFMGVTSMLGDVTMRIELHSMAGGSHYGFPLNKNPQQEREHRMIAMAVSKMLTQLYTMERTDALLLEITQRMVEKRFSEQFPRKYGEDLLRTFLQMWFTMLDEAFENDQQVSTEYKKQKAEAKKMLKSEPDTTGPVFKVWEHLDNMFDSDRYHKILSNEAVRKAIVNKMFMSQSVKHLQMIFSKTHYQRYLLARAVIQMGVHSGSDSKINHIYQHALKETTAAIRAEQDSDYISDTLFEYLEEGIRREPQINGEIEVSKEKIASGLIYDAEMLRVYFSPV